MAKTYFRAVKPLLRLLLVAFMAMNLVVGHDWVHVPALVQHYAEHRAEHPDLSVLEFLAMHYANAQHQSSEPSHEDLPFQQHQHGGGMDVGITKAMGQEPLRAVSFPERNALRDFPLPDADALLSGHAAELLRPPRALA